MVQPILDARQSGIRIACTLDHGAKLDLLERPAEMSEYEAYRIVSQVYLQTITFPGPWKFVLTQ
jgi:hypothetical protein